MFGLFDRFDKCGPVGGGMLVFADLFALGSLLYAGHVVYQSVRYGGYRDVGRCKVAGAGLVYLVSQTLFLGNAYMWCSLDASKGLSPA